MTTPSVQSAVVPIAGLETVIGALYQKSRGAEFGLSPEQFTVILKEIGAKYLPPNASPQEFHELYGSLRIEELALARACAAGNERAWEAFLLRYRAKLYEIAAYIAREDSAARELADSLYSQLYGTDDRSGQRISKLASYTGRGSLEGWLRSVLAQEYVNRYRRQRHLVSLEETNEAGTQFAAPQPEAAVAVDPRVEAATDEALAALAAGDRYVLAAYFLDGRTLAEIARLLGVHESTISRKLDKLATALRKQITATLLNRGMSRRQAEESMAVDVRDLQINIRQHLAQKTEPGTFSKKSRDQMSIEEKTMEPETGDGAISARMQAEIRKR